LNFQKKPVDQMCFVQLKPAYFPYLDTYAKYESAPKSINKANFGCNVNGRLISPI